MLPWQEKLSLRGIRYSEIRAPAYQNYENVTAISNIKPALSQLRWGQRLNLSTTHGESLATNNIVNYAMA